MDTSTLRQDFTTYIQKRFPNDHHISSTVSMAFFLERYGDEFGIDFQQLLADGNIPDSYKLMLIKLFTNNGSKNPSGNASIYVRSLRLLIECISGHPYKKSRQRSFKEIMKPTAAEVKAYLANWQSLSDYKAQEDALNLLFYRTFPKNESLSEVLIKCSTLNDFYGTNIFGVYPVAKHIVNLGVDLRLAQADEQLVDDIASGHGVRSQSGKELHLFSFATKYCSHHNCENYPIYDSYVQKLLIHFRNNDGFADFIIDDLRSYHKFKNIILQFREAYALQEFTLKEIDQYLWQLGKKKFPKTY